MHYYTKQKIRAIREYLAKHGKRLAEKYPEVNGIYIGKKIRGGRTINRYCIIFNVVEKKPLDELDKVIPEYIEVKGGQAGEETVFTVPTDVREVGMPKLQRCLASSGKGTTRSEGTVTGFITLSGKKYYISNMHVMGYHHISKGDFIKDAPQNQAMDVSVGDKAVCSFRRGALQKFGELDIAMAEVRKTHPACKKKPFDLDRFTLVEESELEFVMADPIPVNCFGYINETHGTGSITNFVPGPVYFNFGSSTIALRNLLQISPRITSPKDSGALIYADPSLAYGILVGADQMHSYAINLRKAIRYLTS